MNVNSFFTAFFELLYPNTCACCHQLLKSPKSCVCMACQFSLPKSQILDLNDNFIHQRFWGRIPVEQAFCQYKFQKKGKLQLLMHQLKYERNELVGYFFGRQLAITLQQDEQFICPDIIIPIPLHKEKERKRGYNQSLLIAKGIESILKIPIVDDAVIRVHHSDSQTKKKRYERWENVGEIFQLSNASFIKNQHVLLIDDIVTTGATLEACAQTLLQVKGTRISIATVAYA